MATNNQAAVLFGQGRRDDDFSLSDLSCSEVVQRYYTSDLDLEPFLANSYRYFASDRTMRLFKAMHRALSVISLQGQVRASEGMSALSPYTVDPYERHLWMPVRVRRQYTLKDTSTYDGPLEAAPLSEIEYEPTTFKLPFGTVDDSFCGTGERSEIFDVSCLKRTVGEQEDFLTQSGENEEGVWEMNDYDYDAKNGIIRISNASAGTKTVQVGYNTKTVTRDDGSEVVIESPVFGSEPKTTQEGYKVRDENGIVLENTSITGWQVEGPETEIDLDNPIIVERPNFNIEEGTYWVPVVKRESDTMWNVTAQGSGFEKELRPKSYTPHHWPYFLQLVEFGMQKGAEDFALRATLSGLAGNPFAYVSGYILWKEYSESHIYVAILPDDPDEAPDGQDVVYCEVPRARKNPLKRTGVYVKKFETLLRRSPVTIRRSENENTGWSDPVFIKRLESNTFKFEAFGGLKGFQYFLTLFALIDTPILYNWDQIERGYYNIYEIDRAADVIYLNYEETKKAGEISDALSSLSYVIVEGEDPISGPKEQSVELRGVKSEVVTREVVDPNGNLETREVVAVYGVDLSTLPNGLLNIRLHLSEDTPSELWGKDAQWDSAQWLWLEISQLITSLFGSRIRLRNIDQGFTQDAIVRRVRDLQKMGIGGDEEYGIEIDQYIPRANEGDRVVAQVYAEENEIEEDVSIYIQNIIYNGLEGAIQSYLDEVFPRGVNYKVNLMQMQWEQMFADWDEYSSTWNGKPCPEDVLIWEGLYDTMQNNPWPWAEDNWVSTENEYWGISNEEW